MTTRIAVIFAAAAACSFAHADEFTLWWSTLDGGGELLFADGFELRGTIGQADAGDLSAEGFVLEGGYWVSDAPTGRSSCVADFNGDDFVDFFDYDNYVMVFQAGFPAADVNGDDFIDFFDYDAFVEAFERGC